MIEPKKLSAFVTKQNQMRPFNNPAMYDEESMVDDETTMDEQPDEGYEDELGLDEEVSVQDLQDALMEIVDLLDDAVEEYTTGGNPTQPAKGLAGMRAKLPAAMMSGFKTWAKEHNWEDFVALGEKIGTSNPERFAGFVQAVKHS